ncbi:MAG: hypothetical protein WD751_01870 [Anaerolineales bacterium]
MPSAYDREIYSRTFARLLNQGLKRGKGDARLALQWLEKKYRLLPALLFSRHRPEVSDAYLDVREHFLKRIKEEVKEAKG